MIRKLFRLFIVCSLLGVFAIEFCDDLVENASRKEMDFKGKKKVGVVLGTAKYVWGNTENLFYKYRIQKAVELYKKGRLEYLVVSGDNSTIQYDEPTQMKEDLIKAGVPANVIFCDFAGFSTIDSMLRMKLIFEQSSFMVISQSFHVKRAVYIAKRNGLNAVGVCAKDVPNWYAPYNKYREKLARVKAVLEVLIGKDPYYKGEPIEIKRT